MAGRTGAGHPGPPPNGGVNRLTPHMKAATIASVRIPTTNLIPCCSSSCRRSSCRSYASARRSAGCTARPPEEQAGSGRRPSVARRPVAEPHPSAFGTENTRETRAWLHRIGKPDHPRLLRRRHSWLALPQPLRGRSSVTTRADLGTRRASSRGRPRPRIGFGRSGGASVSFRSR